MQANCKHVKALERYTGHCEPVFVFYQVPILLELQDESSPPFCYTDCLSLQDGKVLNTVSGVNAPLISTAVDKLSAEAAAVAAAKA